MAFQDDSTNGNPLLAEYNRTGVVPPALQPVLDRVRQKIGALGQPMPQAGATLAPPQPTPPPLTSSVPRGASSAPALSSSSPAPAAPLLSAGGNPTPAKNRYNELTAPPPADPNLRHTKVDTGESGIGQIHNPWARNTLHVLDALGSTFFPALTAGLPGTQLHHQMLVRNAAGNVNEEQNVAEKEAQTHHLNAEAAEQESLPEFHNAQNEIKRLQGEESARAHQATEDINRTKNEGREAATLAQHGFKKDENGQIVPLPYGEMSEPQQAVHDLKAAQSEQAEAAAALKNAQAQNAPAAAKLAQQRLESAAQAHAIALRRLGLSEQQFEARTQGTLHGEPLPGSLLTDEGRPVGSMFQQNVRPTGTERTRADLATSATEQLKDMRAIVQKHPEFFGPGAGRKTEFTTWIGSQDPDAQRFRTARTILADHAAGVFGARSEYASKAQEIAAGQFKDNPDAILSGLGQIEKAMGTIKSKGVMRTTGSHAAEEATAIPYTDGGKTYNIPADQEKEFLRDHPKATKANAR